MAQTSGSGAGGGVGSGANQFGDTTYTKVFVGGLAWETQRDTMRRHFEQFGDILEAVVITDKNTGRSKGYGFVTFRDADAARRACADATPIIDGRRANCNLASLGAHRNRPAHGGPHGPQAGGPGYTPSAPFAQPGPFTYPQQGFTYPQYGYPQYPPDYSYPQFPQQIYGGPGTLGSTGVYPYSGFTQPIQGGPGYPSPQGYGAPHLMQYGTPGVSAITSMAPYGGGAVPLQTPSPSTGEHDNLIMSNAEFGELQGRQVGVTPALTAAGVAVPSQQFGVPAPSQQQFSSGGGPDQPTG